MDTEAVLFDLEGTLIDTYDLIIDSYDQTFKQVLNREIPREKLINYIGEPLKKTLARYAEGEKFEELLKTYREHNLERHDQLTRRFPGVQEGLAELKDMGLQLVVVTSKMRDTAIRGLELFDLDSFFSHLVGYEDTKEHKPGPAPVQRALDLLHVNPGKALMIGDSPYDLHSARAAKVRCGIVRYSIYPAETWDDEKPDFWLESIAELPAMIG